MKKVMVHAVPKLNLGDDLFLKILFERYPNTQFIIGVPTKYKEIYNINNVRTYSTTTLFYKGISYIMRRLNLKLDITSIKAKSCDASVYIGGSIFQQPHNWRRQIHSRKRLINENQPFYVLGANFGPFKDEEYQLEYKKIFNKYEDICFRDSFSYNLFKDLGNVRIADDIVFSLDSTYVDGVDKVLVVSVIKPSHRPYLSKYDELYYEKIKEISINFIEKDYKVILMSFCKDEGDEEAIEEIYNLIPEKYLNMVNRYNYRGNLDEALNILSSSSYVVATRFHAMILAWVLNKPVFPIAYSEKMTNVIKDIKFEGLYSSVENLHELESDKIFTSMNRSVIDIEKQRKSADLHFEKLDILLKDTY